MEAVKKSVYLDRDVDEALRASAERDGRSVTKQMNLLLRNALGQQQSHRGVTSAHDMSTVRPYTKDMQLGRAKRPAKKLR